MMKAGLKDMYKTPSVLRKLNNAEGFTMIEVLIAMSILAVGLLAIATMQVSAIRVNTIARSITDRATIAQDKMEQLIAMGYTNTNLDLGGPYPEQTPPAGFTVTWTVADGPVAGVTKLITVSVDEGGTITRMYYVKPEM